MLATPADRRLPPGGWLFERKLAGVRALSTRDGWRPRLWTRDQRTLDNRFPDLVAALTELGGTRFAVDGEIVPLPGRPGSPPRHVYYAFDLLSLDGEDLREQPLRERKELLRDAFRFRDPLRFTDYREQEAEAYFAHACANGWDGLVAKRADSPYRAGHSADWLSFPCVRGQDFVVGGFTDPQGSRAGFGALLVGYHQQDSLRYAGKVGTGYTRATLESLRAALDGMATDHSPFADEINDPTAHWVRPEMVVRVGFAEWTREGRLRHPRFGGVRHDRAPRDVVRETR